MNSKIIKNLLEYLSVILILSYFFISNIILVFTGIIISLYLINSNFINNYFELIYKKSKYMNTRKTKENSDPAQMKSAQKDSTLSLVETIEELGFIPSYDENDKTNAA